MTYSSLKRSILVLFSSLVIIAAGCIIQTAAAGKLYAETLCNKPDYTCVKVKPGQTWEKIEPDPKKQDILKRVNRMNIQPRAGSVVAIPKSLDTITIYDVAPFPRYIDPTGIKTIYISQKDLAWGAYDADGELVWWGPASPGRGYCADIRTHCITPDGDYSIERKQGIECISSQFPIHKDGTKGGAQMPYCMHFYKGIALHGSPLVPGYADSHGCVRLFIEDAKWLNQHFIDIPRRDGPPPTRVIVSENFAL